jgi:hypothetical protein
VHFRCMKEITADQVSQTVVARLEA